MCVRPEQSREEKQVMETDCVSDGDPANHS